MGLSRKRGKNDDNEAWFSVEVVFEPMKPSKIKQCVYISTIAVAELFQRENVNRALRANIQLGILPMPKSLLTSHNIELYSWNFLYFFFNVDETPI